jgi:hypothetical protein
MTRRAARFKRETEKGKICIEGAIRVQMLAVRTFMYMPSVISTR